MTSYTKRHSSLSNRNQFKTIIYEKFTFIAFAIFTFLGCSNNGKKQTRISKSSFDYSNNDDQITGGIKMIPIKTPKGTLLFIQNVWVTIPKCVYYCFTVVLVELTRIWKLWWLLAKRRNRIHLLRPTRFLYYSDKPNDSTLWLPNILWKK
jgi:proline iminopeptidase